MGRDRISYSNDVQTPTTDFLTIKILLNSVISTKGAKFMSMDIKIYYLNTTLTRYKYLKLNVKYLPADIIKQYNLANKAKLDSYIYVEIQKRMDGLPQAGLLAQQLLEKDSTSMDITSQRTPPVCGSTNGAPSRSRLLSTIFEWNTLKSKTFSTSSWYSNRTMILRQTWQETNTSG